MTNLEKTSAIGGVITLIVVCIIVAIAHPVLALLTVAAFVLMAYAMGPKS